MTAGRPSDATTSSRPSHDGTTSLAARWRSLSTDQSGTRSAMSGDVVHTLNPTTVLNFRGAYNAIVDSFGVPDATLTEADLEKFWPGKPWYKPYLNDLPDIYYPGMTVRAASTTNARKDRLLVPGAEIVEYRIEDVQEPWTSLH